MTEFWMRLAWFKCLSRLPILPRIFHQYKPGFKETLLSHTVPQKWVNEIEIILLLINDIKQHTNPQFLIFLHQTILKRWVNENFIPSKYTNGEGCRINITDSHTNNIAYTLHVNRFSARTQRIKKLKCYPIKQPGKNKWKIHTHDAS
jgi:hypothetical protein